MRSLTVLAYRLIYLPSVKRLNFLKICCCVGIAAIVLTSSLRADDNGAVARSRVNECGVDTSDVDFVTSDGILFVRGTVPNRDSILQTSLALEGAGIGHFVNLLQVESRPSDEEVRLAVERALTRSRSLDGCRFSIQSVDGNVELRGKVHSDLQRDLASDIAQAVRGVRTVSTQLERAQ